MPSKIKQHNTQKDAFLMHLQKMDIEMLELILDDSITYFGASKNIFLEKLKYIFNQVRLAGGKSDLKIKHHKKHPNIYYLQLQIIELDIKFVIEDKNGIITKIDNPYRVVNESNIEYLSPLDIFFGEDEKVDFIPTNKYVMNLYRCTQAFEELIHDKPQILTRHDIAEWIKKHKLLYEDVKELYMFFKFNNFRDLYFMLYTLLDELQNYKQAQSALITFKNYKSESIHEWISDYYDLAFYKIQFFNIYFSKIDLNTKKFKCIKHANISFEGDDFVSIIKFNELYQKHFDIYQASLKYKV